MLVTYKDKKDMKDFIPCPRCGKDIDDFTKEIRPHDEVDGKTIKKYQIACEHCGIVLFQEEQK